MIKGCLESFPELEHLVSLVPLVSSLLYSTFDLYLLVTADWGGLTFPPLSFPFLRFSYSFFSSSCVFCILKAKSAVFPHPSPVTSHLPAIICKHLTSPASHPTDSIVLFPTVLVPSLLAAAVIIFTSKWNVQLHY
jgi:hypothetical protein